MSEVGVGYGLFGVNLWIGHTKRVGGYKCQCKSRTPWR